MHARIKKFVGSGAGELVAGDVSDTVAAGLDGVHPYLGQFRKDVRGVLQLDPVELDVLSGGEMPVATIIDARDPGKPAHCAAINTP